MKELLWKAKKYKNIYLIMGKVDHSDLSLCMIVRDEGENLKRFFENTKGYFGEIIVVDTGSTDDTVNIARKYGAKVYFKEWNDDFSEARNESLKYATGKWIVVLDADEFIDRDNYNKLLEYLNSGEGIAYYLNFRSQVPESKAGSVFINSHPRVFKNGLGIYYEGRIHEQIIVSVMKAGGKILPTCVMVEHYGYQKDETTRKRKIERNINILKKEISEKPECGINYYYLGEEYSLLFDWEKAINFYENGILKGDLSSFNRSVLHQNLGSAYLNTGRLDKAIKEAEVSIELNDTLFTPYLIIAEAYFKKGNFNGVIWHLKK
ncbi:hypothetical protein DRQ09_03185, partial [candidate division KSB1 bacterium]